MLAAHGDSDENAGAALRRLLLRYSAPVYRYLLGAVRDADTASDLCQEFAIRFLRGDFKRANPERGRFRDYVKRALINLVNDYHRERQARPVALPDNAPAPEAIAESDFETGWREALLSQTWEALRQAQPAYHAVLMLRVAEPDLPSAAMAERLTAQFGRPMTAENVRKALQRSHAKFAELMLEQVVLSLTDPTVEDLDAELQALDLLKYCRSALEKRRVS